jgi:hypothetical protein
MTMEIEQDIIDDSGVVTCNRYALPLLLSLDKLKIQRIKSIRIDKEE